MIARPVVVLVLGWGLAACSCAEDVDAGTRRVVVVSSPDTVSTRPVPLRRRASVAAVVQALPSSFEATSREATARGETHLQPISKEKTLWFD